VISEDELIDQYLKDQLTPAESEAFENHFLRAPERQQKLRFAKALKKLVAEQSSADAPVAESSAGRLSLSHEGGDHSRSSRILRWDLPWRPLF